jgi:hypothetical protein
MQARRLNRLFDTAELVIRRLDTLSDKLQGLIVKGTLLLLLIVGACALIQTHC